MRHVVVGVDFSDGSIEALRWAASVAGDAAMPMRLVSAWDYPWWWFEIPRDAQWEPPGADEVQQVVQVQQAQLVVDEGLNGLDLDLRTGQGPAGRLLAIESRPGDLLVVGSRGHTAPASSLLGSVSATAAMSSTCPIALVPPECSAVHGLRRVAVGVDGSPTADDAVQWVVEHASLITHVTVVAAWIRPQPVLVDSDMGLPADSDIALLAHRDSTRAGVAAGAAARRIVAAGLSCAIVIREGEPADVLRSAGRDAGVLVVGSRGHDTTRDPFLGSVVSGIVRHPDSVVIAVPPHRVA